MTDTAREVSTEGDESVTLTVDGIEVHARPGELIIEAAERAGIFVPRFCYHPHMAPVGMCRMCLVEVSGPRGFSLQPSCYLSVAEGQEVLTQSEKARKAQEGVLEFLLINHPLDCPVCDKGGECPLQDQALSHGPGESRFVEEKRHWEKPIEIGPLVYLDRERCIQCARCTRFAEEIAGEALIDFAFRGSEIEVATFPDRPFSSYFSGNTVQICPVGALTAAPYRFKSRPWDLEQVESTCTTCSLGCRIAAQSSAGRLVRFLGVDAVPVNQSWLCDKGRFGFEATNADNRLREPLLRVGADHSPVRWSQALSAVARAISAAMNNPGSIAAIGGARFSNEDAYAWSKFTKGVLRCDSVDAQLGDGLPADLLLGLPRATIDETLGARLVITLTGDVREELPVLFLRLRAQALKGLSILECSSIETSLSNYAQQRVAYLPGEIAHLAQGLVSSELVNEVIGVSAADLSSARSLIEAEKQNGGANVVFVIGRASLAESPETIASAVAILHDALPQAKFLPTLRRANVNGALDMGLAPGVLPGRVDLDGARDWFTEKWPEVPTSKGKDTRAILEAAVKGEISVLFLLGSDPINDFPDRSLAEEALKSIDFVVALGTHPDDSNARADVILPVAGENERSGTTTNCEGRVSHLAPKVIAPGVAWAPWTVAVELSRRLDADLGFGRIEEITDEIGDVAPAYFGLSSNVVAARIARDGIVVPIASVGVAINRTASREPSLIDPIATPGISSTDVQGAPLRVGATASEQSVLAPTSTSGSSATPRPLALHRALEPVVAHKLDSYSYRLVAPRSLYDEGTLVASSPSLAPLSPELEIRVHPLELARLGVADGEFLRIRSARSSLEVRTHADSALSRQVVVLPVGIGSKAEGARVNTLIDVEELAADVHLETL